MLASGARSDTVQVCRARVSGAADGVIARRRFEAAIAAVAPASVGLLHGALLVVRRVAPAARLRLGAPPDVFAQAVRAELTERMRSARRPWRDGEAAAAQAVLFADESELIACVLRDWLRGMLAERWWAASVLRGVAVSQWWRREVLPRGDILPAVLEQLATQEAAAAWVCRLTEDEAAEAVAAISAAHALTIPDGRAVDAPVPQPSTAHGAAPSAARGAVPPAPVARAPAPKEDIKALAGCVPEVLAGNLAPMQCRLLALGLGLQRAPAWAHSAGFAAVLRALDAIVASPRTVHPARQPPWPSVAAVPTEEQPEAEPHSLPERTIAPAVTPQAASGASAPPPTRAPERIAAASGKAATSRAPRQQSAQVPAHPILPAHETAAVPHQERAPDVPDDRGAPWQPEAHSATAAAARPSIAARLEAPPVEAVETRFGGVFYLLNVALALNLYGDFTQPRGPNIALSPWDWLALVASAWFGSEFQRDPAWALLATLAGRSPGQPPGKDFAPPDDWMLPPDWLAPWSPVAALRVHAGRTRLRVCHAAGFVVIDVPRERAVTPLAQARALCARHQALGETRLAGGGQLPLRRALQVAVRRPIGRWMHRIMPYLDARLARALGVEESADVTGLVCRYPARLRCTATALDIELSLATLPLPLRFAGLDRDPGWIPAAGRIVAFHFE